MIQPDIIVKCAGRTTAVVDAKYKRDADGPQNSDMYQVIAYGTALHCADTYLFYPETELGVDRTIPIRNSTIEVNTRRIAISGDACVKSAEESARVVLKQATALGERYRLADSVQLPISATRLEKTSGSPSPTKI